MSIQAMNEQIDRAFDASVSPELAATVKHILAQRTNMGVMKLQKILYYVQGYSLAWTGKSPFPEAPEAWTNGPVYPQVRNDAREGFFQANNADVSILSEDTKAIIAAVIDRFRYHTGKQLANLTHQEPPWIKARAGIPAQERSNSMVNVQDMLEYFLSDECQQSVQQPDLTVEWETPSEEFLAAERQRWAKTLEILGR